MPSVANDGFPQRPACLHLQTTYELWSRRLCRLALRKLDIIHHSLDTRHGVSFDELLPWTLEAKAST